MKVYRRVVGNKFQMKINYPTTLKLLIYSNMIIRIHSSLNIKIVKLLKATKKVLQIYNKYYLQRVFKV